MLKLPSVRTSLLTVERFARLAANRLFLAVVVLLLVSVSATAQREGVTIESIMSAPFLSDMRAAPSGNRVAWVQNASGMRNIFVAEAPEFRARQITNHRVDDGQDITHLVWMPDARTIVFVRGGDANRQGEFPNPTSDPAGAEQTIWRVSIDGGEPVRIGVGNNPTVSPRSDAVLFTRRGQIYSAALAGGGEPAQLIRARGSASNLRFSPDGARLAFVSSRGDHSFIGVYEFSSRTLRFISPGVNDDIEPAWSQDGRQIAFIRIPASSNQMLFRAVRRAQPWMIMTADAASGESRVVWRAREGVGSAFWPVSADSQLQWTAEDQIIFPYEGDGWLHLYSVPARGNSQARLLTPGDFEVEFVTLAPDHRTIIFNSNQDDINRRHLWRMTPGDARPTQITRGAGIEWSPVVMSDNRTIVFLRAGTRRPPHAAVMTTGDAREIEPSAVPRDFPERALAEPQGVIFSAADGMRIHGQLFLPANLRNGERRPALIFIHGGSRRQMLLGWHYNRYYQNTYAMNQYLASRGYVVLSINFRSGIGYGMEFREALNYGAGGASEFNDVLGAGLYLRNRADVDGRRIGLWGGSYGGYLTAMGLARASDLFAAGVDIHGVHDWNVGIRTFIPSYNPLERPEDARLAFQSSPMSSLDTWRSPVLLIHGDDDRNVSFSETIALAERLRERNVEVETLVFPDEVHSFLLHRNWVEALRATTDFFDRRLMQRR
jgi:dipeptidyl aminopeptidase/acylaminoacyl peptidase